MVNDGQTIALGGLLQSTQTNNKRKMPFAGDIPFLGEIFTRRTSGIEDRELVLFIPPQIVRDPSQTQAISVPDERQSFDDEAAPFWRVKRKKWFRNLAKEGLREPPVEIEINFIAERDQAMEQALKELSQAPPKKLAVKSPEPKSESSPRLPVQKPIAPSPPKPTSRRTPTSFLGMLGN